MVGLQLLRSRLAITLKTAPLSQQEKDNQQCTDKLPLDLDIKLRVNRPDPSLPDSHGQIWMQLVSAATRNKALFQGKKPVVERQMLDILRLDSVDRFPVSRLVTLWKNKRWRCMITRWCETEIGRATFNISTWDWMASYRIDSVEFILCLESRSTAT